MITDSSTDDQELLQILGIINSFFFDSPKALECFRCYSQVFTYLHSFLREKRDNPQIIDITLRIIKNELASGLAIEPAEEIINDLEQIISSKSRTVLIAEITS
jgi:hypothetical protein